MCFITNNTRKYIAKKDIVCYKVVNLKNKEIYSYWYGFIYELNKKYALRTLQPISLDFNYIRIEEGFHSYKYMSSANKHLNAYKLPEEAIVKCIVPKDSEYYTNGEHMVSNQIIVTEICV